MRRIIFFLAIILMFSFVIADPQAQCSTDTDCEELMNDERYECVGGICLCEQSGRYLKCDGNDLKQYTMCDKFVSIYKTCSNGCVDNHCVEEECLLYPRNKCQVLDEEECVVRKKECPEGQYCDMDTGECVDEESDEPEEPTEPEIPTDPECIDSDCGEECSKGYCLNEVCYAEYKWQSEIGDYCCEDSDCYSQNCVDNICQDTTECNGCKLDGECSEECLEINPIGCTEIDLENCFSSKDSVTGSLSVSSNNVEKGDTVTFEYSANNPTEEKYNFYVGSNYGGIGFDVGLSVNGPYEVSGSKKLEVDWIGENWFTLFAESSEEKMELSSVKVTSSGKCSSCGKGIFNVCDKSECESLGNCGFINTIGDWKGDCVSCEGVTKCSDYNSLSSYTTACTDDICELYLDDVYCYLKSNSCTSYQEEQKCDQTELMEKFNKLVKNNYCSKQENLDECVEFLENVNEFCEECSYKSICSDIDELKVDETEDVSCKGLMDSSSNIQADDVIKGQDVEISYSVDNRDSEQSYKCQIYLGDTEIKTFSLGKCGESNYNVQNTFTYDASSLDVGEYRLKLQCCTDFMCGNTAIDEFSVLEEETKEPKVLFSMSKSTVNQGDYVSFDYDVETSKDLNNVEIVASGEVLWNIGNIKKDSDSGTSGNRDIEIDLEPGQYSVSITYCSDGMCSQSSSKKLNVLSESESTACFDVLQDGTEKSSFQENTEIEIDISCSEGLESYELQLDGSKIMTGTSIQSIPYTLQEVDEDTQAKIKLIVNNEYTSEKTITILNEEETTNKGQGFIVIGFDGCSYCSSLKKDLSGKVNIIGYCSDGHTDCSGYPNELPDRCSYSGGPYCYYKGYNSKGKSGCVNLYESHKNDDSFNEYPNDCAEALYGLD